MPGPVKVSCPACGCDVTDRVRNAQAVRRATRTNKQYLLRVAKLLVAAEGPFKDPSVKSAGSLWRQDMIAIRYVFNRLMAQEASR